MNAYRHWLLAADPFPTYSKYLLSQGGDVIAKIRRMTPQAILGELETSGLRGRGGAGFPTSTKWNTVASHPCPTRYAVCNAAEGEPGTFKDRHLLRHNPYAVIEGLLIAARAVNAQAAYVAVKKSFRKEITILKRALGEMAVMIGDLPLHIVEGPEEYLFGEEKALLEVIEGKDPLPRTPEEPPYERGLFATALSPNPALVNNAETLARVPSILRFGGKSFRELGTSGTPGTILVTLSGDVKSPGVYELPAGLSLSEILHDVGEGPRFGRGFKAALPGVSAAAIMPEDFRVRADFDSLQALGSGLGSAGFIAIGDSTSIPRVTQAVARFLYVESCNQCSACKHGLRAASTALDGILSSSVAGASAIDAALYGVAGAPQGNRCYLPVQGSVLVTSLMERFRGEFESTAALKDAPEWLLPKMTDFNEKTREFAYDARQALKEPNWTYRAESRPGPFRIQGV